MPTNLPPEAMDKWELVEAAHTPKEKMDAMIEFLKYVPHHKGTMKLRGEMNRKIALIRDDMENKRRKGTGKSSGGPKLFIEKEGSAQIALIGMTNVGKSALMAAVTNSKVQVTPTPFSTHEPVPGIMSYKDVQFQIVEAPAVMEGAAEGKAGGNVTLGLARNADGAILMVDLGSDPVEQLELILAELEKTRVLVYKPSGKVDIDKGHSGTALRVILVGKLIDCSMNQVEQLLRDYKVHDAIVRISGEVRLEDVENAIYESTIYKPAVIVANKLDLPGAQANLRLLKSFCQRKIASRSHLRSGQSGASRTRKSAFRFVGNHSNLHQRTWQQSACRPTVCTQKRCHRQRFSQKHPQRTPDELHVCDGLGETVALQPQESRDELCLR